MRNKVTDVNNLLIAQLERLGDTDVTGAELVEEINRARAMAELGAQVLTGSALLLKAWLAADRNLEDGAKLPDILECESVERSGQEVQLSTGTNCVSITARAGKALP